MPINQVATLSVPEPAMIIAQPFDPSLMGAIEKAIRASDLGLNPANDGKVVRIPIPALTDDRRKELSRHVHKQAEEGRNVVRQVRRDANDRLKKLLKDHKISEDDERKGLDQIQKVTDEHVKMIDELQKKKDQDCWGIDRTRSVGRGSGRPWSVAERDAQRASGEEQVVVERERSSSCPRLPRAESARCLAGWLATIFPNCAVQQQLHRLSAEARRQRPIECRRCPAALKVAEDDMACLFARQLLELVGAVDACATETLGVAAMRGRQDRDAAVGRPGAFRHHHDLNCAPRSSRRETLWATFSKS